MSGMSPTTKNDVVHILHFQMFLLVWCLALHKHQQWDIKKKSTPKVSQKANSREKGEKAFSGIYWYV